MNLERRLVLSLTVTLLLLSIGQRRAIKGLSVRPMDCTVSYVSKKINIQNIITDLKMV